MSPFNLGNLAARACITLFAIVITLDVQGQAEGQADDAKLQDDLQKVREFHVQIRQEMRVKNGFDFKLRDSKEFQEPIRTLFAGLNSSEMRLEALYILDTPFYPAVVSAEFGAELLEPLIHDDDPAVRIRAARAVGANSCGAQYASELIALLEGETSVEALMNVAFGMSSSGHKPFVKHLEKMLSHADSIVRSSAALALTRLAPVAAFKHNLRLLDDKDPDVRSGAIHNISRPPGNVVVTSLIRMLDDEYHGVRADAVDALAQMGNHSQSIAPLLKDPSARVRRKVASVLGPMGDYSYLDDLRPLLGDEDSKVRENAARSIDQLETVRNR